MTATRLLEEQFWGLQAPPGCTQSSSPVRVWGEAGERRRGRRPERAREETREDHREERGEEVELAGRGGCAGFALDWEMAFT